MTGLWPRLLLVGWCLVGPFRAAAYAPQQAGSAPLEAALEARVQRLGKQLRCAVCQGLSIADSPASMARAQLDKVRELVAAGQSDDQIQGYFVERYGEWVLLQPKASGFNWLVWLGPAALVALGLVVILSQIGRGRGSSTSPARPPAPPSEPGGDEYLNRVRAELER